MCAAAVYLTFLTHLVTSGTTLLAGINAAYFFRVDEPVGYTTCTHAYEYTSSRPTPTHTAYDLHRV